MVMSKKTWVVTLALEGDSANPVDTIAKKQGRKNNRIIDTIPLG
jgi:hypothetical protein